MKLKSSNNILRAVWWKFPEWMDNYNVSGIVPGISIDMKGVPNNQTIQMMTLVACKSCERAVLCAAEFLESESMDNVEWFLEDFNKVVGCDPMAVGMGKTDAYIGAVKK